MRPRWWLAGVVLGAVAFTLLVSVTSVVRFAYRSPSLHVAVETAAALIALLAAQLTYGRFRRSLDRRDLLLTAALMTFAGANLCFSAIPAIADAEQGSFDTWAPAVSGIVATGLLAAGAFSAPRPIRRPVAAFRQAAMLSAGALVAIGLVTLLLGDRLPRAIDPALSPVGLSDPRIVGDPWVLGMQLVNMALFAAAAVGFARRTEIARDPLTLWFAIGTTLGAFARLNYFLFPSRFSDYFYTGDVLRLGFFVALLIGGMHEIRVAQRELERAAVLNERRRLAREIHDGIAQDLAFIVQQARELAHRNGTAAVGADIVTAASRALDESRSAIAALVRPTDEPLAEALRRVAEEAAGRYGGTIEASVVKGLELSPPAREALLRIVGEAVTNAGRHGRASHIRLALSDHPLQLLVVDDGVGFDPETLDELAGRHGIRGMRERAEAIDGRLHVESAPGEGTQIVVILP